MDENRVENGEVVEAPVEVIEAPVEAADAPVVEEAPVVVEEAPALVVEEPVLEEAPVEEPTVLETEEELSPEDLARKIRREAEAEEKAKKAKIAKFWDNVGNVMLVILMISPIIILGYIFLWFAFPEFFTYR